MEVDEAMELHSTQSIAFNNGIMEPHMCASIFHNKGQIEQIRRIDFYSGIFVQNILYC